jgi:hypothetical protein
MINFDDSFGRQNIANGKIRVLHLKIVTRYGFRADMALVWTQ